MTIDQAWMPPGSGPMAAFAALTLALVALWLPRRPLTSSGVQWWGAFFGVALVAAVSAHLVDLRGLLALLALAATCVFAKRARPGPMTVVAHTLMLLLCAALLLHVAPGFTNPRVLDAILLSPDAEPYTKYLNFDKGVVGLFVLGLYAPDRTASDPGTHHLPALIWRFALLAVVVLLLALALGVLRWDPKFPAWSPAWIWSMVFLTALPEETMFRGVAQEWLARPLRTEARFRLLAPMIVGVLFGVAHFAGGPAYVVLASVAGAGYGWIYASTGSIAAAIAAHASLNTLHFLLFSYPSLAL